MQDKKTFRVLQGGEEIPAGGWRGGEEIPAGGWRGGEEIPAGGWRVEEGIVSDNYRTEDGIGYFSFSFFNQGDFIEIDTTFAPSNIKLEDKIDWCTPSKRGGFTIISEQTVRDDFTARLVAKEWAESIWKESYKVD